MKISEFEINEIKEKFDSERKYKVYEFEDKVIISKDELRSRRIKKILWRKKKRSHTWKKGNIRRKKDKQVK